MKKKISAPKAHAALPPSLVDAAADTAEMPWRNAAPALQVSAVVKVHTLAQAHTARAVAVLREVMDDPEATSAARVTAAIAMLDRGWGKTTQPAAADKSQDASWPQTIRRIIVDPRHSDKPGLHPAAATGAL